MSLRGYIKKGRPALWTQIKNEAGGVTHALNVRAEVRRQEREAKREEEYRRRKIAAVKRQRERQQSTPRKRIAPRSKRMKTGMEIYNLRRDDFLRARPECFACKQLASVIARAPLETLGLDTFQIKNALAFAEQVTPARKHAATTIHHLRGRAGELLLNEKYWRGCCLKSHQFISDNVIIARLAGLLCQPGEWGKAQ